MSITINHVIRRLTNYINHHKCALLWFFDCFYLCQVSEGAPQLFGKHYLCVVIYLLKTDFIMLHFLEKLVFRLSGLLVFLSVLF